MTAGRASEDIYRIPGTVSASNGQEERVFLVWYSH